MITHLISCSEFVKLIDEKINNNEINISDAYSYIKNYSEFLLKELKIKFFVVADENDKILNEPDLKEYYRNGLFEDKNEDIWHSDIDKHLYEEDLNNYNKYKCEILFKNYSVISNTIMIFGQKIKSYNITKFSSFEEMLHTVKEEYLELTDYALEQIFKKC